MQRRIRKGLERKIKDEQKLSTRLRITVYNTWRYQRNVWWVEHHLMYLNLTSDFGILLHSLQYINHREYWYFSDYERNSRHRSYRWSMIWISHANLYCIKIHIEITRCFRKNATASDVLKNSSHNINSQDMDAKAYSGMH